MCEWVSSYPYICSARVCVVTSKCVHANRIVRVCVRVCTVSVIWMNARALLMPRSNACHRVPTISRLLKTIGLFCKRALQKRLYSARETYNFKEPTNRSHPIVSESRPKSESEPSSKTKKKCGRTCMCVCEPACTSCSSWALMCMRPRVSRRIQIVRMWMSTMGCCAYVDVNYGVASISRLHKIMGLFGRM